MYEYEVLQIQRQTYRKTREVEAKRGKTVVEEYFEVESIADFHARVKQTLNDWGSKGWQVISAEYCLPIHSKTSVINIGSWVALAETDYAEVWYAVVLQRSQ